MRGRLARTAVLCQAPGMTTAPSSTVPDAAVPSWARPGREESLDALAFCSGAALALLHPVAAGLRPETPGALLRERLALQAAEACSRLMGRSERAPEMRDEVHLLRPGGRTGPAGAIFDLWRKAARVRLDGRFAERLDGLLPAGAAGMLDAASAAPTPVTGASRTLAAALQAWPREEAAALILAEAALAQALGWPQALPLLATGLSRADLRRDGAALERACHRAVALSCVGALALAADLAGRAERLRQVAPRLRAKGAGEAVRLFLTEDALSPGIALAPVIRGSARPMTDRAARRLCDRLESLGALRELTGRASFRLYGL